MTNTIAHLAQKLWQPAKCLYQEGIAYQYCLLEITWLLLLKMADDLALQDELLVHFDWYEFICHTESERFELYQTLLDALKSSDNVMLAGIYAQAKTTLTKPNQLTQLIDAVELLTDVEYDEWGEMYESMLEYYARTDNHNIYVTPSRILIDMMVIVTQPQIDEIIQDPLAGMGRFLVAADAYMKITHEASQDLPLSHLKGIEPHLLRQRIALANCLLHDVTDETHLPVQWDDCLVREQSHQKADVIFSTLLFDNEKAHASHDAALALLKHIYQAMKPGARAAIIVPDRILNALGPAQQVRRGLLDECVLHTILRLPQGIFYPHAAAAHILFFYKSVDKETTQQIWFYDLRSHTPSFGYHQRLMPHHLTTFETAYGDDPFRKNTLQQEVTNSYYISRETLAKMHDCLELSELNPNLDEDQVDNNVAELWEVLDDTLIELETLKQLLE